MLSQAKRLDRHLPGRWAGALLPLASWIEVRQRFFDQSLFFGQKVCLFSALDVPGDRKARPELSRIDRQFRSREYCAAHVGDAA